MMNTSAFEILGPVMVGPSSSHTAGALRLALVARSLGPKPLKSVDFKLYKSFAHTYHGHGSDRALVAGILGMAPDDIRVRNSFELAKEEGLEFSFTEASDKEGTALHPNTVAVNMVGQDGMQMSVTGESLGGGKVRISSIDGIAVEMTGDYPTLFVAHQDRPGVLAALTSGLSASSVNIATMRTFRESRGGRAYTVFEVDDGLDQSVLEYLSRGPSISFASLVNIPGASQAAPDAVLPHGFETGAQLLRACATEDLSIGQIMRERELELEPSADVDARMAKIIEVMREETVRPIEKPEPHWEASWAGRQRPWPTAPSVSRTSSWARRSARRPPTPWRSSSAPRPWASSSPHRPQAPPASSPARCSPRPRPRARRTTRLPQRSGMPAPWVP